MQRNFESLESDNDNDDNEIKLDCLNFSSHPKWKTGKKSAAKSVFLFKLDIISSNFISISSQYISFKYPVLYEDLIKFYSPHGYLLASYIFLSFSILPSDNNFSLFAFAIAMRLPCDSIVVFIFVAAGIVVWKIFNQSDSLWAN